VFDLPNDFFNVIEAKTRVESATERLVDGAAPTRPIAIDLINHTRQGLTAEGRRLATLSLYRSTETTCWRPLLLALTTIADQGE
jgi:hypothetical protein